MRSNSLTLYLVWKSMCHITLVVAGIVIPQLKLSSCICLPSGSLAIKRLMMAPCVAGVVWRSWRLSPIHQSWHYSESQIYCTYDIESFYRFYSSLDMQRHIGILKCYAFLILYNMKLDHPKKDAWSPVVGLNVSQSLGFTSPFSNFIVLRHAWCQAKDCDCCPCCLPLLI